LDGTFSIYIFIPAVLSGGKRMYMKNLVK